MSIAKFWYMLKKNCIISLQNIIEFDVECSQCDNCTHIERRFYHNGFVNYQKFDLKYVICFNDLFNDIDFNTTILRNELKNKLTKKTKYSFKAHRKARNELENNLHLYVDYCSLLSCWDFVAHGQLTCQLHTIYSHCRESFVLLPN